MQDGQSSPASAVQQFERGLIPTKKEGRISQAIGQERFVWLGLADGPLSLRKLTSKTFDVSGYGLGQNPGFDLVALFSLFRRTQHVLNNNLRSPTNGHVAAIDIPGDNDILFKRVLTKQVVLPRRQLFLRARS
jgi:hypothetical protein